MGRGFDSRAYILFGDIARSFRMYFLEVPWPRTQANYLQIDPETAGRSPEEYMETDLRCKLNQHRCSRCSP
jgi:hypothetical protein